MSEHDQAMTDEHASPSGQQRKVLSNRTPRGGATKHAWGGLIFGLPFAGVGVFIILVAAGVFSAPGKVHVPMWVLGMVGVIFALPGLAIMVGSIIAIFRQQKNKQQLQQHPHEPWLADYSWDRQRVFDDTPRRLMHSVIGFVFMSIFLVPFNYLAFTKALDTIIVPLMVGLFDLIALSLLGVVIYLLFRLIKYGRTSVRFERFPFFLGQTLDVRWTAGRGIGRYDKITFTLRCIEEKWSRSGLRHGSRSRRKQKLRVYQIWSDTFTIQGPGEHHAGTEVPVTFLLPADAVPTQLSDTPTRYWELQIEAETPGVNFDASYLLPVYQAK